MGVLTIGLYDVIRPLSRVNLAVDAVGVVEVALEELDLVRVGVMRVHGVNPQCQIVQAIASQN